MRESERERESDFVAFFDNSRLVGATADVHNHLRPLIILVFIATIADVHNHSSRIHLATDR